MQLTQDIKLPAIGDISFKRIIADQRLYIDKTEYLLKLFDHNATLNTLFTRPRRFGKTLNMNMIARFIEMDYDGRNKLEQNIFQNLKISQHKEFCQKYQQSKPVIFISFRNTDQSSFESIFYRFCSIISEEAQRLSKLIDLNKLSQTSRDAFLALVNLNSTILDAHNAHHKELIITSISCLISTLVEATGIKPLLLIDEYDVPLNKAKLNSLKVPELYDQVLEIIRGMFQNTLKDNENYYKAFLTGCLRISKESIFTGLNNIVVDTIDDDEYSAFFGFTEQEVIDTLNYYNLKDELPFVKENYDGYTFGSCEIYNPWEVLNFINAKINHKVITGYWINSSSNDIIKQFIAHSDQATKSDIEALCQGKAIAKQIITEIDYEQLQDLDLIWSMLYLTGYLTKVKPTDLKLIEEFKQNQPDYENLLLNSNIALLKIPNKSIRQCYIEKINTYFSKSNQDYVNVCKNILDAFVSQDDQSIRRLLNKYLQSHISVYDLPNKQLENPYHNYLNGILTVVLESLQPLNFSKTNKSNTEFGMGRSDLSFETQYNNQDLGIIIEIKQTSNPELIQQKIDEALKQISDKSYADGLFATNFDLSYIICYAICFYGKSCSVKSKKLMNTFNS